MTSRLTGVLIAMAALLTTGLSTGGQIYYLLFYTLLLLTLLSLISVLWLLFSARIEMRGVKPRVERGEAMMTIFTVRHTSPLPVAALRIRLNVPSAFSAAQEISVSTPAFKTRTFRYMVRCPHRGSYEVGITRLRARDAFGLFSISRKSGMKLLRVDVYPKSYDVPFMELKAGDTGPELRSRATEDASSPSDVRKWQEGDVLKKVHWKLTMRRRELMVRTFEESSRPDTLIVPDLAEIQALPDQALTIEDCVCEACLSQARAQLNEGYPVRMPLLSSRPGEPSGQFPQDVPMFAEALMRAQFDSPYPYEQVLVQMLRRTTRTGGCVLVTPRLTTRVADMALKLSRTGVRVRLLWVTDSRNDQSLEMIERLKMENVEARAVDPWEAAA